MKCEGLCVPVYWFNNAVSTIKMIHSYVRTDVMGRGPVSRIMADPLSGWTYSKHKILTGDSRSHGPDANWRSLDYK
jgi:hypothetical protein